MSGRKTRVEHKGRVLVVAENNDSQQTEIQDGSGKVLAVVPFGVDYQQELETALDKVVDENIT